MLQADPNSPSRGTAVSWEPSEGGPGREEQSYLDLQLSSAIIARTPDISKRDAQSASGIFSRTEASLLSILGDEAARVLA